MKKPLIPALDGHRTKADIIKAAVDIGHSPLSGIIHYWKINDAAHLERSTGQAVIKALRRAIGKDRSCGIFLDLKLTETNGSLGNIARHYADSRPDILTVTGKVSTRGFIELRRILPKTKIALVSVLSDITEEECRFRWCKSVQDLMISEIEGIQNYYRLLKSYTDPATAFDMVVCSPDEVGSLSRRFSWLEFVVPGIRDAWMGNGQQARFSRIVRTLDNGADYVVIGAQIARGNPEKGITAEESRNLTLSELNRRGMT